MKNCNKEMENLFSINTEKILLTPIEKNSLDLYHQMSRIEIGRCSSDMLYDCIVNVDSEHLQQLCNHIHQHITEKWSSTDMSSRMANMLRQVVVTDDRVAKHALIFFALYQVPSLCQLFTHPTPRVPPEKFTRFVQTELPVMVEKLMQGSFTSLRAFVEDTRWVYVTL